jgi:elongation factor Tu
MKNLNENTLKVDATSGPTAETREQIISYRQAGVREIAVILTNTKKIDDQDLLDLVEAETRDLLSSHGYDGENTRITRE